MISSYSVSTRHKFLYLLGQSRPTAGRAWWNMTSLTQGPNWPFRCLGIWCLQILVSADPANMDAKSQMTELATQRVICSFITNWHLLGRRWGVYVLPSFSYNKKQLVTKFWMQTRNFENLNLRTSALGKSSLLCPLQCPGIGVRAVLCFLLQLVVQTSQLT